MEAIIHVDANLAEIVEDENENIFRRKKLKQKRRKSEQEKRVHSFWRKMNVHSQIFQGWKVSFRKGNCYDNELKQ